MKKKLTVIVTEERPSPWTWTPVEGDAAGVWGYIIGEYGYLTLNCNKKNGIPDCLIEVEDFAGKT